MDAAVTDAAVTDSSHRDMSGRVQDWCARCGFGPRELTRVTADMADGRRVAIQVCVSCRDVLTSQNGKRP
jgi:hypothetical protein